MLLKKILYRHSRVRYVICQQTGNGYVSITFCRWISPGTSDGSCQYFHTEYVRHEKVVKDLKKLKGLSLKQNLYFSYDGTWEVIFYSPEIREILWKVVTNFLFLTYFLYPILWRLCAR
jgi:hypothetical protein